MFELLKYTAMIFLFLLLIIFILVAIISIVAIIQTIFKGDKDGNDR